MSPYEVYVPIRGICLPWNQRRLIGRPISDQPNSFDAPQGHSVAKSTQTDDQSAFVLSAIGNEKKTIKTKQNKKKTDKKLANRVVIRGRPSWTLMTHTLGGPFVGIRRRRWRREGVVRGKGAKLGRSRPSVDDCAPRIAT